MADGDYDSDPYGVAKVLGAEIRKVRDRLCLTRQQVVDRLHREIAVQTLANYENGIRSVGIGAFADICTRGLGVSASDLLALALQRIPYFSDTPIVDLRMMAADQRTTEPVRILRRWASGMLARQPSAPVMRLERQWITNMAMILDVTEKKLDDMLERYAPPDAFFDATGQGHSY